MAHLKGSQHPRAKLTEAKVRSIFVLFYDKDWSTYRIAAKYGVNRTTIDRILRNELWTHVTH